jgi:hypothetical protein
MLETVTMGGIVFGLIVLVALFVAAMIAWPKRRETDATAPGDRTGSDMPLYVAPWGSTPAAPVDAGHGAAADPSLAAFDGGSSGGGGGGTSFDGGGSDGGGSAGGGSDGGGGASN